MRNSKLLKTSQYYAKKYFVSYDYQEYITKRIREVGETHRDSGGIVMGCDFMGPHYIAYKNGSWRFYEFSYTKQWVNYYQQRLLILGVQSIVSKISLNKPIPDHFIDMPDQPEMSVDEMFRVGLLGNKR